MAEPPELNLIVHIAGGCLVCRAAIIDDDSIKLVREEGHYADFAPDGRLVWADAAYGWVHLAHTN